MEERRCCKLCERTFVNGKALGGHMRSHVVAKKEVLVYSSSSSSEGEESRGAGYGLRENPKRSVKVVDAEFSFAVVDAGSVVHDRESESEVGADQVVLSPNRRPCKIRREEPTSSVSESSPEEDVALCLMMLSRDFWLQPSFEYEEEYSDPEPLRPPPIPATAKHRRARYQCGTCRKTFRSYQALGGHRASHKKTKPCSLADSTADIAIVAGDTNVYSDQPKLHECPFCDRVFNSGQALGGHKRSHLSGAAAARATAAKKADSLIDLNLPAPIEDDQASQVELSALSSDADLAHFY